MRSSTASRRPRTGKRTAGNDRDFAGFESVRKIALTLPGIELGTGYGAPALKVNGHMFACMTTHKSSEPGSLAIWMSFADRDELVANDPSVYYLTPHYEPHPCVVVRLSRVHQDALKDLLHMGLRFVATRKRRSRTVKTRARRA